MDASQKAQDLRLQIAQLEKELWKTETDALSQPCLNNLYILAQVTRAEQAGPPSLSRSKSYADHSARVGPSISGEPNPEQRAKRRRRVMSQQMRVAWPPSSDESSLSLRPASFAATPGASEPMSRSHSAFSAFEDFPQLSPSGVQFEMVDDSQQSFVMPTVGVNPEDFLLRQDLTVDPFFTVDNPDMEFMGWNQTETPTDCPSIISGSSVMEASMPMTRQNSSIENSWMIASPMVHGTSSQSMWNNSFIDPNSYILEDYPAGKKRTAADLDLTGLGTSMLTVTPDQSYKSINEDDFLQSTSMERSDSNRSNSSSISTSSHLGKRCRDAHLRALENGKVNKILPRETPTDHHSNDQPAKKAAKVAANSKPLYQRPKHAPVMCDLCDDHPSFRGDHELLRHRNLKHNRFVRMFQCRDPLPTGQQPTVTPRVPLADCKHCQTGKRYGAYYNAAAHLRRTHFKPKTSRSKGKVVEAERRGGKAGGYWPSMEELRPWMEEIDVPRFELESMRAESKKMSGVERTIDYTSQLTSQEGLLGYEPLAVDATSMLTEGSFFDQAALTWTSTPSPNVLTPQTMSDMAQFSPGLFA